jgi:hypothetical protein
MTEDEVLAEVRKHAENCCVTAESEVLCQYHLGMVDGVAATYALAASDPDEVRRRFVEDAWREFYSDGPPSVLGL